MLPMSNRLIWNQLIQYFPDNLELYNLIKDRTCFKSAQRSCIDLTLDGGGGGQGGICQLFFNTAQKPLGLGS